MNRGEAAKILESMAGNSPKVAEAIAVISGGRAALPTQVQVGRRGTVIIPSSVVIESLGMEKGDYCSLVVKRGRGSNPNRLIVTPVKASQDDEDEGEISENCPQQQESPPREVGSDRPEISNGRPLATAATI